MLPDLLISEWNKPRKDKALWTEVTESLAFFNRKKSPDTTSGDSAVNDCCNIQKTKYKENNIKILVVL